MRYDIAMRYVCRQ